MRHFNIAEYILRSTSRFEGEDPLLFADCAGAGIGVSWVVVLLRLAVLDRFLLFVTIHTVPGDASLYRRKIPTAQS